MAVVLVRLKLALLANAFRRSPWQVIGMVLAVLYGLGLTVGALTAVPLLARQDDEFVHGFWVLGGSLVVLGWIVIPLISAGADMTLDPRRFTTFAVPRRSLLLGLGGAALVGVPGLVTLVLSVGESLVWSRTPHLIPVAILSALVGVVTCIVFSRAATVVFGQFLASRYSRVVVLVAVSLPVALFVFVVVRFSQVGPVRIDAEMLPRIAEVLGWTPLGAAWAVTVDVAVGNVAAVFGHAALALVTIVALVWVWSRCLSAAMENPDDGRRGSLRPRGLGLFGRARTPLAAMTARCLSYWLRDARYAAGLAIVPFVPLVFYLAFGGRGLGMLALGPAVAFILGWAISVDVAYDGSAFWMQLSSGVSGWVDRGGRVAAVLILAAPIELAAVVGSLWLTGRWDAAPAVVGMTAGVLLVSCGLSSVLSVLFVYPVPAAGENPFTAPSGSAAVNLATQVLGWTLLVACVSPALAVGVLAIVNDSALLGAAAAVLGIGGGGAALWAGMRGGARIYESRGAALLEKVVAVR